MTTGHLVLECEQAIAAALDKVSAVDFLYLSPDEKAASITAVGRLEARLAAVKLRLLAVADEVAEASGARDVGAWFQHAARVDRGPAGNAVRLAKSLDRSWHALAEALSDGRASTVQAMVIAHALDDLPADVDESVVTEAERVLVEHAATYAPRELRLLGRRILDVVAPEVGEEHERKALEDEERHARARTSVTTTCHHDGTTTVRARIPDAAADRLLTYLHAWTNPRRADGTHGRTDATTEQPYAMRLGHAFCALLEHLDPARLPLHGGTATTVMITIPLESMLTGLGIATTGADGRLTAGEVRRLACTANVVPLVLGGHSEVLDAGRAKRLFTAGQRRALSARDQRCRADGCDIPADWCEAHHLRPWSRGGRTDLSNAILFCSHHHHRAHDERYLHDRLANGDMRFHRRT
ncbi:HNH endonuclease signature motif containing protein [Nocardioides currus]|uniref:HNH endonuclease n=1 Tax=Nocardioides currus TaxID=2133958 RepID=A0A2R7YX16_9ACTN|nr:HNH endonuclease signature motif containing protein [Nocardioides currus]PUA80429.1 HNH endonuclease [Nocardioides currus]